MDSKESETKLNIYKFKTTVKAIENWRDISQKLKKEWNMPRKWT